MKALILCDRESTNHQGWDLRSCVRAAVRETGATELTIVLNGDEIKPCLGCYKCWVKTPGFCIMTNDCANTTARQEIQADVVIFLSKITYGGFSYDLKSFIDRSIPNISPYFEIVQGDMRHGKRYDRFPYMITIGYGANKPEAKKTSPVPDAGFFDTGKAATSGAKGAYSSTQLSGARKLTQPEAKKTSPDEEWTFISLAERNALIMRPEKYSVFILQNSDDLNKTMEALKNVLLREI